MALTFTLTPEGIAALRNARGDGTNAVRVVSMGVTATDFTPGKPLPNELKRIVTLAGGATQADTLHVTATDNAKGVVYSVRGFGLYLADGTLLGSYGQPDVIVEKSSQSDMLLAADIQFKEIDATLITLGSTNFNNPAATTDTLGVLKLSNDDEAIAGIDSQKAITPKTLLAALNARLGAGAPSAFIKSLLTKANVVAFCTALGIRGAAQYDTGDGNGLDADKLDGQHGDYYRDWRNFTNVPELATPGHKHSADDITSGTLPVARGGTGVDTITADAFVVGNGANPLKTRSAAQVLVDIGAAAKSHSHAWDNINNPPETATRWPNFSEVANKPSSYPPSAHSHQMSEVTGLADALNAKADLKGAKFTGDVTVPNLSSNGNVVANTNFISTNGWWLAATNGLGNILFRPRGSTDASAQVAINGNADLATTGALSGSSIVSSGGITAAVIRSTGTITAAGGFQIG